MKKISILSLAFVCILASCKKSNSGSSSNYHFTATIDGTAQTFNVSPLAVIVSAGGQSVIGMEGFAGSSSSTQSLAVAWNNSVPGLTLGVGTYYDTASNYSLNSTYTLSVGQAYVGGTDIWILAEPAGVKINNHLKLTISAVDSTHIKGTFSGDLYFQDDISGAVKTITNGDFDVPWKK